LNGKIDMSSSYQTANYLVGSGGSIWLKADTITGSGSVNATGGKSNSNRGGGGRIRFDFNTYDYTGIINVGGE